MPLSAIVGHTHLVDLLRRAVASDRVPQSLLFAGPDGVGKRATAIALAQAVNCPTRRQSRGGSSDTADRNDDACGTCATCRRIARGQHSDVVLLDRGDKASIRIDALRERVLSVVGYRPFEAARRVYIIDTADDLVVQAQDALLKTLEEPPPSALIILVTAFPDTPRPTIQSRCRRLRFGPLAERDVARILADRCGVEPAAARLLAAVSGGSVSRAMADADGDLTADRDAAMGVLTAAAGGPSVLPRLKASAVLVQHAASRRASEALGTRLSMLSSLLRDLGALSAGVDGLANVDLADNLRELTRAFTLERVSAGFASVYRGQAALERNASPKIIADWIAVTI